MSDKCLKCGQIVDRFYRGESDQLCQKCWEKELGVGYTHLEISQLAFNEIKGRLIAAGYSAAVDEVDGQAVIDMHGIRLMKELEGDSRC